MDYRKIVKLNKRQFDAKIVKEGQTLLNHTKNIEEKVFFSKVSNTKSSQDKLIVFYSVESSISKGDILFFRDNYYVILNENCPENDAWRSSTMVKCNTVWNLFGEVIPMVASDLSSPNPTNGSIPTVNGVINFYTGDTALLHTKIGINDYFYDFGGCYKLVNKFFIDGLAYLYFQRDTHNQNIEYTVKNANYAALTEETRAKFYLSYQGSDGNYFLPTAKFEYTSSDETVARVEDDMIIPLSKGTTDITATCNYVFDYGNATKNPIEYTLTKTFGVGDVVIEPDNPEGGNTEPTDPDTPVTPPAPTRTLEITSAANTVRIGGTRKLNLALYEDGITVTTDEIPSATFTIVETGEDATGQVTITDATTSSALYFNLADNTTTNAWVGKFIRVTLTYTDGTTGSVDIEVIW